MNVLECIGIAIVACALHEAAHLGMALWLGIPIRRAGVCWTGIYTVRYSGTALQNAAISLAGPMTNVLLVSTVFVGMHRFAWVNAIVGLVNLLPIEGSDGWRILHLLAEERKA